MKRAQSSEAYNHCSLAPLEAFDLAQTKVDEFGLWMWRVPIDYENIRGFYVPVHDAVPVSRLQRPCSAGEQLKACGERELGGVASPDFEGLAFDELHHHKGPTPIVIADLVDAHKTVVIETAEN